MMVYRLAKAKYANDMTGKGAEISGGRWNSKGTAMIYTGASRALCTTEIAVHMPLGIIPIDYQMVTIAIPDDMAIYEPGTAELPSNWHDKPHGHATQVMGDAFVREHKFAVMKVPSAVVEGDYNYLINPCHPNASSISIIESRSFIFDTRMFKYQL